MNWFRKMMIGRYGLDQLSIAIIVVSMILTFVSGFSPSLQILYYISYIVLALGVVRMFSRNIQQRRLENSKFTKLMSPAYSWINKSIRRLQESKTHKYFDCPSCKATLRVPKGKGKISITCPKCGTGFIKKT